MSTTHGGVNNRLPYTWMPTTGVGPHPWPRHLRQSAPGHKYPTAYVKNVTREGEMPRGMLTVDGRPGSGSNVVAVVVKQDNEIVITGIRARPLVLAIMMTHDVKLPITASPAKSNTL